MQKKASLQNYIFTTLVLKYPFLLETACQLFRSLLSSTQNRTHLEEFKEVGTIIFSKIQMF